MCGRDKLSLTRTTEGILYNCYRDSCDTAGIVRDDGVRVKRVTPVKVSKLKPYEGDLRELRAWEYARFLVTNGLTREAIETRGRWKWSPTDHSYAFPMLTPAGYERGVVLRRYDGRTPKALTRQHTEGPSTSWHYSQSGYRTIALVEDQVSSVKLSEWVTTVALLGTAMSHEAAREIAHMRPDRVVIALDEDAVNTAYRLKEWFGLLFKSVQVMHLHKDIKDTPRRELQERFYERG